jgi:hypothetical protein
MTQKALSNCTEGHPQLVHATRTQTELVSKPFIDWHMSCKLSELHGSQTFPYEPFLPPHKVPSLP